MRSPIMKICLALCGVAGFLFYCCLAAAAAIADATPLPAPPPTARHLLNRWDRTPDLSWLLGSPVAHPWT